MSDRVGPNEVGSTRTASLSNSRRGLLTRPQKKTYGPTAVLGPDTILDPNVIGINIRRGTLGKHLYLVHVDFDLFGVPVQDRTSRRVTRRRTNNPTAPVPSSSSDAGSGVGDGAAGLNS